MQPQQNTATTASLTAPVGGWNARDSLASMPPTDTVNLTNFWPTPTDVRLRNGWTKYSTGITGQVNTVMTYAAPSGQQFWLPQGQKYTTVQILVQLLPLIQVLLATKCNGWTFPTLADIT